MISIKCDRTFQSFWIRGTRVDVVKASDGSVRLRVHSPPGSVTSAANDSSLGKFPSSGKSGNP